jgi:peroxiredoxin
MKTLLAMACSVAAALAAAAEAPQTLTPLRERPLAPDFALTDLDGRTQRLHDARGKVVLVNFWATWCPPCRQELPSMQRAWSKLKGEGFAMFAIDIGEDDETILPFIFSTGVELTFPILLDRDSTVTQAWPVVALPTSFVLDPAGRIVYRAVGGREWDDPGLMEKIRALMRSAPR